MSYEVLRREKPGADPLTERELDVLKLIMEGLSNEQISERLFLSPGTVKWYVKQIYAKIPVGCKITIDNFY